MNYCPNCGNRLSPSDVLCSRCGSLIERLKSSVYTQPLKSTDICPPAAASADISEADAPLPGQIAMQDISGIDISADSDKKWLEIEEIGTSLQIAEANVLETGEPEPDSTALIQAEEIANETENSLPAAELIPVQNTAMEQVAPDDGESRRITRRIRESQAPAIASPREHDTKKRAPAVVVLLVWILTTAAVFAGFYFAESYVTENYGGWDGFVRDVTKGKVELDINAAYMSNIKVDINESETQDGTPAHRFDVSLTDGQSVTVIPLGESHDMQNGSVSFTVPDEALAKSLGIVTMDTSMETSGVSLDVKTASQTLSYPVTSLTLKLTDAQYKREKPSADTLTTTDTALKIALTVSTDATVFINNANRSNDIDSFGHVTATMPLELGENDFVIDVIQPGKHSVKENFTITRELPPITLSLRDTYLRVYESSFECRGTTQAGAVVTALLDGKKITALVGTDGAFSLVCALAKTGVYQMDVTASKEGLADATAPVMVEYLPAQTAYMENAAVMTVDKIVKDMNAVKGKDLKTSARIDGNITNENHTQTFSVISKEGAAMTCYYYGPERLSAELEYTFYGVVDAEKKSFYVMFVE